MVTQEIRNKLAAAIARGNESIKTVMTMTDGAEWRPTFKDGECKATLRVLPIIDSADPIFRYHRHKFGWSGRAPLVNERCPRDKKQKCSYCDAMDKLRPYIHVDKSVRDIVKMLEPEEVQVLNVYVVDDPNARQNNNRVMFMYMRRAIGTAIKSAVNGYGASVFDVNSGWALVVWGRKIGSNVNYNFTCVRDLGKPLADSEEEITAILARGRTEDQMRLSLGYPSEETVRLSYCHHAQQMVDSAIQKLTDAKHIVAHVSDVTTYPLPYSITKAFDKLTEHGHDNFMIQQRINLFVAMKEHGSSELNYKDEVKFIEHLNRQAKILDLDIEVDMPASSFFNLED